MINFKTYENDFLRIKRYGNLDYNDLIDFYGNIWSCNWTSALDSAKLDTNNFFRL